MRLKNLLEKAVSKAQRRLFAIALAFKRGELDINKFDNQEEIRRIAKDLPTAELRKFAKTKEKNLPQTVKPKKET